MLPRKFRQYSNRNLFIALAAIIVVSLVATIATLVALSALVAVRMTSASNSYSRMDMEALRLSLRTAESDYLGYVISGDPDYLSRYHAAAAEARTKMSLLASGSKDASYYDDVQKLQALVAGELTDLDKAEQLVQTSAGNAALVSNFEQSKATLDKISTVTSEITQEQEMIMQNDQASVTNLAGAARDISVGTLVVTLLVAGIINYLYIKDIEAERKLDRAKDEFVSLASHQLRTPATGVKSILSTLVAGDFGPLSERQSYFVGKALQSNERELAVIEELLNVAKADAGRLVLNPSEVDVGALVDTVVSEQRRDIEAKHIRLDIRHPAKPVVISADQEKLYMALGNLVDNARKYTPESGRISVKVSRHRDGAAVEVADTGVGIDSSEIDQIFDRFGRARAALAGNADGAGLGLYLTQRITELHQGTIEVDSKLGRGSRFTLFLPVGRT